METADRGNRAEEMIAAQARLCDRDLVLQFQNSNAMGVIPGRAKGASPESISPGCGYGFRARRLRAVPE